MSTIWPPVKVSTSVPLSAVMLKFAVWPVGTKVPSDWALRTAVPLVGGLPPWPSNENCTRSELSSVKWNVLSRFNSMRRPRNPPTIGDQRGSFGERDA
jgi:hypothetical protein